MRPVPLALLGVAVLAGLAACGTARRGQTLLGPYRIEDPLVLVGERQFMQACNQCHPRGEAGLGPAINNKPLPAFLIRYQIRNGIGAMPAFDERALSEAEVDAIIAYLLYLRDRGPFEVP